MRIICADNRPGVGIIRGSVAEDDVFKPNTKVYLAHREPFVQNLSVSSVQKTDMSIIDSAITDDAGNFVFTGLNPNTTYSVIAYDNDVPMKEPKIISGIRPVEDLSLINWTIQSSLLGAQYRITGYDLYQAYRVEDVSSPSGVRKIQNFYSLNGFAAGKNLQVHGAGVSAFVPYRKITSSVPDAKYAGQYLNSVVLSDTCITAYGVPSKHSYTRSVPDAYTVEFLVDLSDFDQYNTYAFLWDLIVNQELEVDTIDPAITANLVFRKPELVGQNVHIYGEQQYNFSAFLYVFLRSLSSLGQSPNISFTLDNDNFEVPLQFRKMFYIYEESLLRHVVIVIQKNGVVTCYVNGDRMDFDQTTLNIDLESFVIFNLPVIAANVVNTAFFAVYPRALTIDEINALYRYVSIQQSSLLPEYQQRVFSWHPVRYYSMEVVNDGANIVIPSFTTYGDAKSAAHLHPVGSLDQYVFDAPSPVNGGKSIGFSGNASCYLTGDHASPFSIGNVHFLTFTCWLKLTASSNRGVILEFDNGYHSWYVDAGNYLCFKPGVTINDITTNFRFDLNVWYFIAFVVGDALLSSSYQRWFLYVGSNAIRPALRQFNFFNTYDVLPFGYDFPNDPVSYDLSPSFVPISAATKPSQLVIGKGLCGYISEVALIPRLLTEADIVNLWQSRVG